MRKYWLHLSGLRHKGFRAVCDEAGEPTCHAECVVCGKTYLLNQAMWMLKHRDSHGEAHWKPLQDGLLAHVDRLIAMAEGG